MWDADIAVSKRDLFWSWAGTVLSMLGNLLTLPLLLVYLSGDELGLWYVFQGLGALALLFDFGFNAAFSRNAAYCWSGAAALYKTGGEKAAPGPADYGLMKKLLFACKRIYLKLALAALLFCLSAGAAYVLRLSGGVGGGAGVLAAWVVYSLGVFFNLYFGRWASFLRGVGAVALANRSAASARFAQLFAVAVLLRLGLGILAASAGYLVYGLVFRGLSWRAFLRYGNIGEKLRQAPGRFAPAELDALLGVIWHNAWRDGAVALSNYGLTQAGTVICSMFYTLAQTAGYSLAAQLAEAVARIASAAYPAYQPSLQRAYIAGDAPKARREMSFICVSFAALYVPGVAALFGLGLPLLGLIKTGAAVPGNILLIVAAYRFLLCIRNFYCSYISCTNRLIYMPAFLVTAGLCAASSLFCAAVGLGIWALPCCQIASHLGYNLWKWPLLAHRELNLRVPDMPALAREELRLLFAHKKRAANSRPQRRMF